MSTDDQIAVIGRQRDIREQQIKELGIRVDNLSCGIHSLQNAANVQRCLEAIEILINAVCLQRLKELLVEYRDLTQKIAHINQTLANADAGPT